MLLARGRCCGGQRRLPLLLLRLQLATRGGVCSVHALLVAFLRVPEPAAHVLRVFLSPCCASQTEAPSKKKAAA